MYGTEERLSKHRPVVVYDQLGCGRSDKPDDASLWTLDYFTSKLDQMREALGLDECHLLGHSWGGWLSIDYLCRSPEGISKVVLASTSSNIATFVENCRRLMMEFRFEESSRMAHVEEADAYSAAVETLAR